MARVDQVQGTGLEVQAPDQGCDELVGGGVRRDVPAGPLGLLDEAEAAPPAVAQASDTEGGELRGGDAVPHGVGDRQVQRSALDHVVERVAAGVVGRHQPAGQGELRSLAGVGRRQETSLDLGFEAQVGVALPELVQVAEPAIRDDHVGERVAGRAQVVQDLSAGRLVEQQLQDADRLTAFADGDVHPHTVVVGADLGLLRLEGRTRGRAADRHVLVGRPCRHRSPRG